MEDVDEENIDCNLSWKKTFERLPSGTYFYQRGHKIPIASLHTNHNQGISTQSTRLCGRYQVQTITSIVYQRHGERVELAVHVTFPSESGSPLGIMRVVEMFLLWSLNIKIFNCIRMYINKTDTAYVMMIFKFNNLAVNRYQFPDDWLCFLDECG